VDLLALSVLFLQCRLELPEQALKLWSQDNNASICWKAWAYAEMRDIIIPVSERKYLQGA